MAQEVSAGSAGSRAQDHETGWLSALALFGLAAGGMIGSGWFSAAASTGAYPHYEDVWAWVLGGVIMLALAIVMVELSIYRPKTGGLIFHPLESSGPLVATLVAAGLWLAYALNSAAEAEFMAKEVAQWTHLAPRLSLIILVSLVFMILILTINLLPSDWFVKISLALTLWKILVPFLAILLFVTQTYQGPNFDCVMGQQGSPFHINIFNVLIAGTIVFSYTGYQAPMDFAGDVRKRGTGAKHPVRAAVYSAVVVGIILYTLLQLVFHHFVSGHCNSAQTADSPYIQYASHLVGWNWFAIILMIDAIASPLGAGMIYSYALTGEVSALSRKRLTAFGLQTRRQMSFPFRGNRVDVYWRILWLNLAVGLIGLLVARGNWKDLTSSNSTLNLFVYAFSCIALIALVSNIGDHRRVFHELLARLVFAAVALTIYWSEAGTLLSMVQLAICYVVLLGLPLLSLPSWYDAKAYAKWFWSTGMRRTDRGAQYAVLATVELVIFLVGLTLLSLHKPSLQGKAYSPVTDIVMSAVVALITFGTFELVVHASRGYIRKQSPPQP